MWWWLLAACSGDSPTRDTDADGPVIVVGAGVAGLACAGVLEDAILIEADTRVGGRALWSGGAMHFVGVPEQAGLDDDAGRAAADWETITGDPADDTTLRYLEASPEIHDRLQDLGVRWSSLSPEPRTGRARILMLEDGGPGLVAGLQTAIAERVDLRLDTRVDALLREGDRVRGVRVGDTEVLGRAVVIASGGYAGDAASLSGLARADAWEPTNQGGHGDALAWAEADDLATARLDSVGWYLRRMPIPDGAGGLVKVRADGVTPWIGVDANGARFCDESQTWSVTTAGPWRDAPGARAVAPYDALRAAVPVEQQALFDDAVREDRLVRCRADARTLAGLEAIDPAGLERTLASIRPNGDANALDEQGRRMGTHPEWTGALCAFTLGEIAAKAFGGLSVDAGGHVRDSASGEPLANLYAIGEAAGMAAPGIGGRWGFDGSLSAVTWSGWNVCEDL
jgi:succinate dehydrogenase/fumarate reductase flavoprotein subunit